MEMDSNDDNDDSVEDGDNYDGSASGNQLIATVIY